jgi:hypothetical protein
MKYLCTFLITVQVLLIAPARAETLCPLVTELNAFLVEYSTHQAVPCPEIGFTALPAQGAMRSQAGAYLPATGRIELAPDLVLATAYGKSFLLHELVHAAQFSSGADKHARCPAALEAEAYQLQASYQRAFGLTREALLTDFLANQLGSCGAAPDY